MTCSKLWSRRQSLPINGRGGSRQNVSLLKHLAWVVRTQYIYICKDIEELTRKTGNFKQFLVFVTMLESAINKVCYVGLYMYLG